MITDAADVGFGSFYNHFESKEALFEAGGDSSLHAWPTGQGTHGPARRDPKMARPRDQQARHPLLIAQGGTLRVYSALMAQGTPSSPEPLG